MWSFRKLAAVGHTVMNSCSQCNRRDNSTQHHDIYQWEGHALMYYYSNTCKNIVHSIITNINNSATTVPQLH
ncbi:hypothetical protein EB796_004254 [Bugula neritina]|uniref:Uncharacterized protein n=1 Tax=Bugula neritina TaxID=10212 RepID=A0A7J7KFK4_BUGNE|nr:hypothetical protein EB796_004254 [Bugula neritina]